MESKNRLNVYFVSDTVLDEILTSRKLRRSYKKLLSESIIIGYLKDFLSNYLEQVKAVSSSVDASGDANASNYMRNYVYRNVDKSELPISDVSVAIHPSPNSEKILKRSIRENLVSGTQFDDRNNLGELNNVFELIIVVDPFNSRRFIIVPRKIMMEIIRVSNISLLGK